VRSADGNSRVGVFELMLNNTAVRNNIKKREISQMDSIIETSAQQGMISLSQYAKRLIDQKLINPQEVNWIFEQRK
jgi:twitching motility protein PilT